MCHQPGRGQLLNSKSHGGNTFRGEMILGSQAGGNCSIMTNCWYFHKMIHLECYKFRLRCYLIFFLLFHKRAFKKNFLSYCFKIIGLTIMHSQLKKKKKFTVAAPVFRFPIVLLCYYFLNNSGR